MCLCYDSAHAETQEHYGVDRGCTGVGIGLRVARRFAGPNKGGAKDSNRLSWHGITPADLVFPFFLVIVGMSMAFSFATRRPSHGRVLRRSALLFALGFFFNAFPHFNWRSAPPSCSVTGR